MKLTQKNIEDLEYIDKDFVRKVGDPNELYVRVFKTKKSFYLILKHNRKTIKYTIGNYCKKTFNLQMARNKANKILIDFKTKDIIPSKTIEKTETLHDLYTTWKKLKEKRVAKTTMAKDISRVKKHILSNWGDKDISYFNTLDFMESVVKYFQSLNLGDTTKRTLGLFKDIINPLVVLGKLDTNPIYPILDNYNHFFTIHHKKNFPFITEKNDIKALLMGVKEYKGIQVKYALYVAILSALRNINVRNLEWDNIDFDKKLITIDKKNMKSKRDFILPMSFFLEKALLEYKQTQTNLQGKVFKGIRTNKGLSENALNNAIRCIGFEKEQLVSHGLRSMFRTICGENIKKINTTNEILEKCLDHKLIVSDVQNHYDHSRNISDMKIVFDWWGNYLNDILPFEF